MERERWREMGRLSPASVMLLTLLFIVLTQAMMTYILLKQPWTGLRLHSDSASGFLRVESVVADSPSANQIPIGTVLRYLQFEEKSTLLTQQLFLSGFFNRTHADYRAYLQNQENIPSAIENSVFIF
jgi:hypothetical protein